MADKWIKMEPNEVQIGDICKRNPEWGPVLKGYCSENIEINGWTQDEEFIVAELRPYNYIRCDRPWEKYDTFDWSLIYDDSVEEDKKQLDDMGRNGDKHDSVYFLTTNMLWLSRESKRERELQKILD